MRMKVLRKPRSFEWDDGNRGKNFQKHKVTDEECEEVFSDPFKLVFADRKHSEQERRFVLVGTTKRYRHLFVIFTIRDQRIRVVSARDLKRKEYRFYKEQR